MTISATIPATSLATVNATLEAAGFGPSNFSVPLRNGAAEATHAGLHSWDHAGFLAALQAIPEVTVTHTPGDVVNFPTHVQARALEWSDPTDWVANPVMTGDQRTFDGKTWESLIDYNVWPPGVSGWREVVAVGYPEWIAPTGAHDAYNIGDRVTFEGADYESVINGNSWSPAVYPAGWTAI